MFKITLSNIINITGGRLCGKRKRSLEIKDISIDSRSIKKGSLFIAIKGQNYDGHDFIDQAIGKGACAVITKGKMGEKGTYIIVKNTLRTLGQIAAFIRDKSSIPIVAITGTNGKTTVKEMTAHLLSGDYNVLKSKRSYNNIIGISLTLFNIKRSNNAAVLEIGTNNKGEIKELSEIVRPHIACITNIGRGHLKAFKDKNGVLSEKMDISGFCEKLFINSDDILLKKTVKGANIIRVGHSNDSDFTIKHIDPAGKGFNFLINDNKFFLPLIGKHNVQNASLAISIALYMGVKAAKIRERLSSFRLPPARLEMEVIRNTTFIDDSYNSNPDSFERALETIESIRSKGRKIIITGAMLELGNNARALHIDIGKKIALSRGVDILVTVGRLGSYVAFGASANGMDKSRIIRTENVTHLERDLKNIINEEDTVLLKASNKLNIGDIKKCYITS